MAKKSYFKATIIVMALVLLMQSFMPVTTARAENRKFDDYLPYSLSSFLNGYATVAFGNATFEKHTMGAVLAKGDVTFKSDDGFADAVGSPPSYVQGYLTGSKYNGRNDNSTPLYVSDKNTVEYRYGMYYVNGYPTGMNPDIPQTYTPAYISNDFFDFDKAYKIVCSISDNLVDYPAVHEPEYYQKNNLTFVDLEIGETLLLDDPDNLPDVINLVGDLNKEELTLINIPASGVVNAPVIYINGNQHSTHEQDWIGTSIVLNVPNAEKVVWDKGEGIDIAECPWIGHIVAPKADVKMEFGQYDGTTICQNFESKGENHVYAYNAGDFSAHKVFLGVDKTLLDPNGNAVNTGDRFQMRLKAVPQGMFYPPMPGHQNLWGQYPVTEVDLWCGAGLTAFFDAIDFDGVLDYYRDGVYSYHYTLEEVAGFSTENYNYDTTKYNITINVTKKDGVLTSETIFEKNENQVDNLCFHNSLKKTLKYIDITVKKEWDHTNSPAKPTAVTLMLMRRNDGYEDSVVATKTLTASNTTDENNPNEWSYTFTDLPERDANGNKLEYYVVEEPVKNYVGVLQSDGLTLKNTYQMEYVSISGTKNWEDNDNSANTRPSSITVELYKNGTKFKEQTLPNADNSWNYSFTKLDKYTYDEKTKVEFETVYTVKEKAVDGYTPIYKTTDTGFDITNKATVDIDITKKWQQEGKENPAGTKATFNLYRNYKEWGRNGVEDRRELVATKSLDASGWAPEGTVSFAGLDRFYKYRVYYMNGSWSDVVDENEYEIEEVPIDGYVTDVKGSIEDGFVITNIRSDYQPVEVEIAATKKANGKLGGAPAGAFSFLLKDGDTVIARASNAADGSIKFTGLKFYKPGDYNYTVAEDTSKALDGWTYDTKSYNITIKVKEEQNKTLSATVDYKSGPKNNPPEFKNFETTSVQITKVWNQSTDINLTDALTLHRLEVSLDGKVHYPKVDAKPSRDAETGNIYTWSDLPKYTDKSELITYVVKEAASEKYTTAYPAGQEYAKDGQKITNTLVEEKVDFAVTKVWVDNNNATNNRPASIDVQLLNGTFVVNTVTLPDSDGNWSYTWTDLPKYAEGSSTPITYTVAEVTTAAEGATGRPWLAYYTPGEPEETTDGYTITNTLKTGGFTFTKQDESGTPLSGAVFGVYTDESCTTKPVKELASGQDGVVSMTGIEAGTTYYIKEITAPSGYVLNKTVYSVTIEAGVDNKPVGDNGVIVNEKAKVETSFGFVKRITNYTEGDLPEQNFTFTITPQGEYDGSMLAFKDGYPVDEAFEVTIKGEQAGGEILKELGLTIYKEGTYEFTITENTQDAKGNSIVPDGWYFEPESHKVQIPVTKHDGRLTVGDIKYNDEFYMPTIVNSYYRDTSFYADKKWARYAGEDDITLELYYRQEQGEVDGVMTYTSWEKYTGNYEVKLTKPNGEVELGEEVIWEILIEGLPEFVDNKAMHYGVAEEQLDGYIVTYMDASKNPITKDENGLRVLPHGGTITNTKIADGQAQFVVNKSFNGTLTADQFTFELLDENGNAVKDAQNNDITATNDANGVVTFQPITYTLADMKDAQGNTVSSKTFIYNIREVEGSAPGVTYDDTMYTAEVTVRLDATTGTLTTDPVKYYLAGDATKAEKSPVFNNEYAADGSVALTVKKILAGGTFKTGDSITFTLTVAEGQTDVVPMPTSNTVTLYPAEGSAEGTVSFLPIQYTLADVGKDYSYNVQETACNIDNVISDTTLHRVTVTIEDNGDGTLAVNAVYADGGEMAVVTNTAVGAVNVPFTVRKTLNGADYTGAGENNEGDFTFVLKEGTTEKQRVSAVKAGAVQFAPITYRLEDMKDDKENVVSPKTFTYTISEEKGSVAGVTYSTDVYTAVVTLTYNEQTGKLEHSVVYTKNAGAADEKDLAQNEVPVFANTTEKVNISVTKVWNDSNNAANKRPASIDVQLKKNGTAEGSCVTLPTETGWSYTWENLPKYDSDGEKITYTVEEGVVEGYTKDIACDSTNGNFNFTITNTYSQQFSVSVPVKKTVTGTESVQSGFEFELMPVESNSPWTKDLDWWNENENPTVTVAPDALNAQDEDPLVATTNFGPFTYTNDYVTDWSNRFIYLVKEKSTTTDKNWKYDDRYYWLDYRVNENSEFLLYRVYSTTAEAFEKASEEWAAQWDESEPSEYDNLVKLWRIFCLLESDGLSLCEDAQAAEFVNTYVSAETEIALTKKLDGQPSATEFDFTLTPKTEGDKNQAATVKNSATGGIVFGLKYGKADMGKTYVYEIAETPKAGYYCDSTVYTVTVAVGANLAADGNLPLTVTYKKGDKEVAAADLVFENASAIEADLTVEKTLTTNANVDNVVKTYSFTLTPTYDGATEQAKTIDVTVDGTASPLTGSNKFELSFAAPGTYTYTVAETVASELPGYTYDEKVYTVTYEVELKEGRLQVAAPQITLNGTAADKLAFTNEYKQEAGRAALHAKKVFTNGDLSATQFTFELLGEDGKAVLDKAGKAITATSNANGEVTFPDLHYDAAGTYKYVIKEKVPADADKGSIVYDEKSVHVTVLVERNDNKLNATVTYDGSAMVPTFTNKLVENVQVTLSAQKMLNNASYSGEEFAFELKEGTVTKETVNTVNGGKVTFAPITYTLADLKDAQGNIASSKDFTYTIVEVMPEGATEANGYTVNGMTYDPTEHTVTVKVELEREGTALVATVTYDGTSTEAPVFENTYDIDKVGELTLNVTKTMTGRPFQSGDSFTFELTGSNGAPMPKVNGETVDEVIITPTSGTTAAVNFGEIKFTEADLNKIYTYTIVEVMPKGATAENNYTVNGVTYDTTEYTVQVKVTEGEDALIVTPAYAKDGMVTITNTYTANGELLLTGTKEVKGVSTVAEYKNAFTFGVFDASGAEIATGTNDDQGNITFTKITYDLDQVGTYLYTVKEIPTVDAAVSDKYKVDFDETVYEILVNVANNPATGNLDVNWSISKPAEATKLAFTNDFQLRKGIIGVWKVDSKYTADEKVSLAGAEFTVYTDKACQNILMLNGEKAIITTSETGGGSLTDVPFGTYWVKETKAPKHYKLDNVTKYPITVDDEKVPAVVNGKFVTNKKLANVQLVKSDLLNPSKKLPGAEYTLFTAITCKEDEILILPDGNPAVIKTGANGMGELEGVPAGTYWVKETKAPTGYEVDPKPHEVVVGEETSPDPVDVRDFPLRGALSLSKTVVASSEVTDTFLFDIELTLETGDPIVGSYEATLNGAKTDNVIFVATETGAKATVELKDGETLSIKGLRSGVSYTVTEQPNSRYDVTVNGAEATAATGTITDNGHSIVKYQNTLKETGFTVEKVWLGEDAGEIKLTLYANGVAMDPQPEVTRDGNTYSYENLVMKDENGEEIVYTVKETAMAGYTTTYQNAAPNADKTDAAYNGGKIINQAMTTFAVKKEWSGLAQGEKAPAIQLTLYCNGKVYTAATPTPDKDGWYTYADLPAYVDGEVAVYTVKEQPVTGFTTTYINKGENAAVTDCAYNGSTIVNSKIPQTGDNTPLTLWMLTTLLAACGLMGVMATLRKREN